MFGKFILIIENKINSILTIHNDRYGMVPFYEYNLTNKVYYSFSLYDFLRNKIIQNNINYSALSDILAYSIPLGNKTLIEKINSYKPGTKTSIFFEKGIIKKESKRDIEQILKKKKLSFDSHKNELVANFIEGFKKCVKDKNHISITLSGGIDSRCLLSTALFLNEKKKIHTYNYSVLGSRSQIYSKKMSEMCNVDYTSIGPEKEFVSNYYLLLKYIIERTEGMTFSSEVEGTWLRDHMMIYENNVILHGAFGELSKIAFMHEFKLSKELKNCGRDEFTERLWKQFESRFNLMKSVFSDEIQQKIEELSKENLKEKIIKIDPSLSNEDILICLYIEEYIQKVTKYSNHIWNHKMPIAFVFSNPKYMDLMLQIKNKDKVNQKFQMYLLEKTSKELFEFPDSNTGTKLGSSEILNKVIHKLTRLADILFKKRILLDHSNHIFWIKNMTPSPEKVLKSELFNKKNVSEIISKARNGDIFSAVAIQKLLLFDLWQSSMKKKDLS